MRKIIFGAAVLLFAKAAVAENVTSLPVTNATFSTATELAPAGTTSATGVMMGLGSTYTITPTGTGRVTFTMQCTVANTGVSNNSNVKGYFGTGTAPANGAALIGTAFSNAFTVNTISLAGGVAGVTISKVVPGLTLGTAYWFDSALQVSGGTGTLKCQSASVDEH